MDSRDNINPRNPSFDGGERRDNNEHRAILVDDRCDIAEDKYELLNLTDIDLQTAYRELGRGS